MSDSQECFHCGLPVPEATDFHVTVSGEERAMCCAGCQAVAQAIVDNHLEDFYRHRTSPSETGQELVPEFLRQAKVYDNPTIQRRFVRSTAENEREASLILEGITCAACVWLNERHISALPGVLEVQVNYSTHRARVRWDETQIQLSDILYAISQIGYLAHPYDPQARQALLEKERRQHLRRIGLAGVMGMQVMMFSVALYAGDFFGMDAHYRYLFHWINLLLTLPVMFYSARPFFQSAWRDLKHRQAGMDVPVALGISIAFTGSVWVTVSNSGGHVYYDSVVMFVFFLLLGRYFELMARKRSAQASESLVQLVPAMATRQVGEDWEEVAVIELVPGDVVQIRPGETVPADGAVLSGRSSVDESLLTGESLPIPKQNGENLTAGTVNIESPLQMRVDKIGEDTVLSHILRLLERAQTEKPHITQVADRAASWFVLGVLLLAGSVALYWWQVNPDAWLSITLAVLVVTCPCALSLATPTAITAATGTLTRHGLLTTRGHALETLARATHFVFDKTGTLTEGRLHLSHTECLSDLAEADCLRYAAALEKHSEHPLAKALVEAAAGESLVALEVSNQPGAGLRGQIKGRDWFIGTAEFIQQHCTQRLSAQQHTDLHQRGETLVWLADAERIHCAFTLSDQVRDGAEELVRSLHAQGKAVYLLTGDHQASAARVAEQVGIKTEHIAADLSPADKLAHVKALQAEGAVVAMLGDGVNDAPVLAAAQVSIAMGGGTQAARASADMILLSEQLPNLLTGLHTARKTLQIIRQNLSWAVGYNLLALPLAAMGFILPWMAAIGMSASSLLVVLNALRLVEKD